MGNARLIKQERSRNQNCCYLLTHTGVIHISGQMMIENEIVAGSLWRRLSSSLNATVLLPVHSVTELPDAESGKFQAVAVNTSRTLGKLESAIDTVHVHICTPGGCSVHTNRTACRYNRHITISFRSRNQSRSGDEGFYAPC